MTLAEKLRMEGKIEGKIKGLRQAVELGMILKFPDKLHVMMSEVNKIKEAIKTAKSKG